MPLIRAAFFAAIATLASAADFETVRPILEAKCIACHGSTPQGKLDLRTPEAILKGGSSGPVVVPGSAEKSLLITKAITGQMPPGKLKLSAAEIDHIRAWIDKGLSTAASGEAVKESEVRAILQVRCAICHGGLKQEGGLDIRTVASRLKGGKSGPALVPGKPDESLLLKRIVAGQMPPDKLSKEVAVELPTETEVSKIRAWIAEGAPGPEPQPAGAEAVKEADRKFWSFQPPVRPAVPTVKNQALVRNPIDAFLLQKLEAKGLNYSPEANRLALMRRVYLDLIGIPPTPAEVASYLADRSTGAYEKLVDRLLASPNYGERWGQHWLDLAGYSDSEGFGQDDGVRPYAWRYRDYVIRSLNADKPYTQFLTEQIAGDELSNEWKQAKGTADQQLIDRLAATGFLRTVPDPTNSPERGLIAERMDIVAAEVEVLTSSVMGLTVGCARCHNHKYDPIPQRDYYRFSAVLQAAYNPYEWNTPKKRELDLALEGERHEAAEHNEPIEAEIKRIQARLDKADSEAAKKTLTADLNAAKGKLKPKPHIRVLTDNDVPSTAYLLRRGDPVGFGDPVEPNVPSLFQNAVLKPYQPVSPFAGASGRRLALARWLTQPNHPLTARVMVNQMWMRHFGRGIVASVSNFGRSGVPPSHPELLDWLATEFVQEGWSMKALHRLMVTSQAYRQTSRIDDALLTADPENVLVSRMPLKRMDAETLYDSLLTVTGRLDPTLYGKPSEVEVHTDKEVTVKPTKLGYRRSIYVLHRRQTPVSLMDAFDQPAMTPNCTERRRSNVATQALHMMNGSTTWELARFMAGRVIDEAGGDRAKQIDIIYLRTFSRPPTESERRIGMDAVGDFRKEWPAKLATDNGDAPRASTSDWLALANYCHALLNSAEFSFID